MKTFLVYLVMGRDGRYLGPHGWTDLADDAQRFDAAATVRMLKLNPNTSAISAGIGYELEEEPAVAQHGRRMVAA